MRSEVQTGSERASVAVLEGQLQPPGNTPRRRNCGTGKEARKIDHVHAIGQIRGLNLQGRTPLLLAVDRKSTRLNSSHGYISYAVFCLKKKKRFRAQTTSASRFRSSPSAFTPTARCRSSRHRFSSHLLALPLVLSLVYVDAVAAGAVAG